MENTKETVSGGRSRAVRVIALIGVILLALMVIATFIITLLNKPELNTVRNTLFICDVIVPFMLWMYMYLYQRARKTDAEIEKIAEGELLEEQAEDKE